MISKREYFDKGGYKEDSEGYFDSNCWSRKQFYILEKNYDYVGDFNSEIFIHKVSIKSIGVIAPETSVYQINGKNGKKYSGTRKDYQIFNTYKECLESEEFKIFKDTYREIQKEKYLDDLKYFRERLEIYKNKEKETIEIIDKLGN